MSEFVYIQEPFKEAYEKLSIERNEPTENIESFIDSFFISPYENVDKDWLLRRPNMSVFKIGAIPQFRYYVLCASSNDDNVNMWNYYVKDGAYRGYNLGLDTDVISSFFSNLSNPNIKLVSGAVIYDKANQIDKVYKKLRHLLSQFDSHIASLSEEEDDTPIIDNFQDNLSDYINEQKVFFKNPAFASEQEYRFVLKIHNDFSDYSHENSSMNEPDLKVDFRIGASSIITPYVEWKFDHRKALLLKRITLSPMIEPGLAKESFKRFLAEDVYRNIDIKESAIKLRY
jgi:hypothetical protein